MTTVPLDVRADDSVAACLSAVGGSAGRLDVLVSPRRRYIVGRQAKLVTRLRQFLPEGAFEAGARSTFRLDKDG